MKILLIIVYDLSLWYLWFWQKIRSLSESLRKFWNLKISRIFIKCVNLWRVNLWRGTVCGIKIIIYLNNHTWLLGIIPYSFGTFLYTVSSSAFALFFDAHDLHEPARTFRRLLLISITLNRVTIIKIL